MQQKSHIQSQSQSQLQLETTISVTITSSSTINWINLVFISQTRSSLLKVDGVGNVLEEAPAKLAHSLLLFCKGLGWLTSVQLPGVDRRSSVDNRRSSVDSQVRHSVPKIVALITVRANTGARACVGHNSWYIRYYTFKLFSVKRFSFKMVQFQSLVVSHKWRHCLRGWNDRLFNLKAKNNIQNILDIINGRPFTSLHNNSSSKKSSINVVTKFWIILNYLQHPRP